MPTMTPFPALVSFATLAALLGSCTAPPLPQDSAPTTANPSDAGDDAALKQANNPLANMKSVALQDYYIPELSGTDETANQFWLRYAQPIDLGGPWLMRASLPVLRYPTGGADSESGLGDANVFASYLFDTGNPSVSAGVGPLLGLPTATEDALGTDQWSAGGAAVYFDASDKLVQWGGLLTYQHKIGGSDRVDDVNLFALQPFGFLQLGGGTYLRSVGIMVFDAESGNFSIPVGIGLGKVVKHGNKVFNFYVEPQFTIWDEGLGQPEFQVLAGFNLQFLGGS